MWKLPSQRRIAAGFGLMLYVAGACFFPLAHIVLEHAHPQLRDAASGVDPTRLLDPRTGRVDLDKLADALGWNARHDESMPHSHTPGQPPHRNGPIEHGAGSIEHFGIAFLVAGVVAFVPERPAPLPRSVQPLERSDEPPSTRLFLAVQRAQAPPA